MLTLYGFLNSMDSFPIYSMDCKQGRNTLDHLVRFETFIRNAFAILVLNNIFLQCDIFFHFIPKFYLYDDIEQ